MVEATERIGISIDELRRLVDLGIRNRIRLPPIATRQCRLIEAVPS
jgi:hypothetical protein